MKHSLKKLGCAVLSLAMALTLLDIAAENRRKFALIHFAGSSECKVDVFLPGQYSVQDKMNAAEMY